MKKFVVLLLVLFTTMVLAHSASAIEVKRGLIKRLCINNAELGVKYPFS